MKFTFPPETRVLDGYTIKRAIYRGGFGEVYYALSDAGREVALKLLQNNSEIELRGVQQCLNLTHPNLVTIFDIRKDVEGDHWIIMEYVAGETLDAAVRKHPAGMPMELVRKWLNGIAAGVGFLHSRGLVHRDLKPANVFSDGDIMKVGDVGLSKFITPSRRSAQTQSVGTVYYMAPEVAKGRYGKEVDVYALGIMLYEMLTGRVPFDGESTGEILMKHLSERPDLTPLPPRLQPVIGQALEKDPEQRFNSLEAFTHAFDGAVLGREDPWDVEEFLPVRTKTVSDPAVGPRPRTVIEGTVVDAGDSRAVSTPLVQILWPSVGGWWTILGCSLAALFLLTRFGADPGAALFAGVLVGYAIEILPRVRKLARRQWPFDRHPSNALQSGLRVGAVPGSHPITPSELPPLRRFGQWLGTSALSTPLILALTAGIAVLAPSLVFPAGTRDMAALGMFASTALVGTWMASLAIKMTEPSQTRSRHTVEDNGLRRMALAAAGALTGLAACGISEFLLIPQTNLYASQEVSGMFSTIGEQPLLAVDLNATHPTWLGYMVFFIGLFGLRSWWKLGDLHRDQRFGIGSTLLTALVALLWTSLFAFPQTWGVMWGATIAAGVQLASPWAGPRPASIISRR